MSREEQIDYGEIKNSMSDNKGNDGNNRYGDYGRDTEGNLFVFTVVGWLPINNDAYEAKYWKKKYFELLNTNT